MPPRSRIPGVADDLLGAAELIAARGGTLGRPLFLLASTSSTNDEAKHAAKSGAPHGATWVAEQQTAGRGRQGRTWYASPGESLLFSVLIRIPCPLPRVPPLALVVGLAVRDAVARAAGRSDVRVKWPNDVVAEAGRKKVAGVLIESMVSGRSLEALVVGVGVNVHTRHFPDEVAATATSVARLAERGGAIPERAVILADILEAIDRDVGIAAARGLGLVHGRLDAVDALRGERVRSEHGEGVAAGIDAEGRLLVRRDDGTLERWSAGEVHLVPSESISKLSDADLNDLAARGQPS